MLKKRHLTKLYSSLMTIMILGLIIFAGPAQAFSLNIDISNTTPVKGDITTITAELNINSEERLPVENLTLELDGPTQLSCHFFPNGNIISGCNDIIITPLSTSSYTFGNQTGNFSNTTYNFGYGYGYGYNIQEKLSYKIELNTSNLNLGVYETTFKVKIGSEEFSQKGEDIIVLAQALNLTVYSPENKVYNTKRIPFNITTQAVVDILEYKNNNDRNPRFSTLCRDCDEYGNERRRIKTLREGENNLTFKATINPSQEVNVSLFIDSIAPRIIRTSPRGGFTQGLFNVEFDEDNPFSLILHYGNNQTGMKIHQVNISSCILDRRYQCQTQVNLSEYDEQEIEYFFNLTDIAKNNDLSRAIDLQVDFSKPIINYLNITIERNRVNFLINITELNFDKEEYFTSSSSRWKILCSALKNGICNRAITFPEGYTNITIKALDEANNSEEVELELFIDSISPRISRTTPKRNEYTNGSNFLVRYTEEFPETIELFWNPNVTLQNCTSGRNQECSTSINLTNFDNSSINYYFKISDKINSVISRLTKVFVDTTTPELTIYSPENINYSSTRIPFNITISEPIKLEYYDILDSNPRWRIICSRCDEYGNERRKIRSFSSGNHSLLIRATDNAGNTDIESIDFMI